MRGARWCTLAVLVLGLVAVPVQTGRAQTAEDPETTVLDGESLAPSEEIQRWWGVLGAAICGTEMWLIRTNPVLGMQPAALAAGISGCLLAILDVAT